MIEDSTKSCLHEVKINSNRIKESCFKDPPGMTKCFNQNPRTEQWKSKRRKKPADKKLCR
jgi:hypothetical protein